VQTFGRARRARCAHHRGGRGIGREHALLFAAEGARLVVNDLGGAGDGRGADAGAAESVVQEIVAAGGEAVANTDSVASFGGARAIVAHAVEAFGDLHVVVNNAGILRDRMLVSMSDDDLDAVVAVHLKGTFNVTRHAAAHWRDQAKAGREVDRAIVSTSSGAGLHGNVGQTNYVAAKAGIAAMTIVNAAELKRYHVRANCIAPIARTRLTLATPGIGEVIDQPQFDPERISPLVGYLATADCPFTGQTFSVFGGGIGLYQGWSIADELPVDDIAGVSELAVAMDKLPRRITVRNPERDAVRRWPVSYEMPLEQGKVREFARATQSGNPAYEGPEAIVPATFLTHARMAWEPRADATGRRRRSARR
jgi:NAD(P)-dependent dehydrogenase (short-subunit alcohol dehydrogenase family)